MGTGWVAWLSGYAKEYLAITFLISVVVGDIPARLLTNYLYRTVSKIPAEEGDRPIARLPKLPAITGYLERAFMTAIVIWMPGSAGTFIGGWIALKMVGGWGTLKTGTTRSRAVYSVALIGSLASAGWAVALGFLAAPWWPGMAPK
jgi:hypothetical protein